MLMDLHNNAEGVNAYRQTRSVGLDALQRKTSTTGIVSPKYRYR
jgi:hypothetical protein